MQSASEYACTERLTSIAHKHVREAVVEQLNNADHELATLVAEGVGVTPPAKEARPNHGRSSTGFGSEKQISSPPDGNRLGRRGTA